MTTLSPDGQRVVQTLSNRYGLSTDAVTHMMISVRNGNGTMAQFGHPEFRGSGQWMQGGMTMVSDLFDNNLKCLVNNLCSDIAHELANHQSSPFVGSSQSQSQNGVSSQSQASGQSATSTNSLFVQDPSSNWWPADLGVPTSVGSQNSLRYAYFAAARRLAVTTGGDPWVYDTLDHQINGFGQQQGGGQSITFTSQYGTVDLGQLPIVFRDGQPVTPATEAASTPTAPAPAHEFASPSDVPASAGVSSSVPGNAVTDRIDDGSTGDRENLLETLERLGDLNAKGYITDEEFAEKKRDILERI